jgi:hypothetical protein
VRVCSCQEQSLQRGVLVDKVARLFQPCVFPDGVKPSAPRPSVDVHVASAALGEGFGEFGKRKMSGRQHNSTPRWF